MLTVLHHNDADGFGAAYALWAGLTDEATFIPVQYGQPVPEIPVQTTELLIVDFSYDRQTLEALAAKYDLTVLDHHKTAQQDLEGLPYAHFDMTKAGCRLAWEYIYPFQPLPDILSYVEDRDLWKFDLPFSEEVNLYIASLPWDFEVWDNFDLDTAVAAGKAVKAFRDNQIQSALKNVRRMQFTVNGCRYEVPVVNASANVSELGNEMCKAYPEAPFSVSYCDRQDVRSWSLRSIGEFDVSAVAKEFGGGGHRNAAGFATEIGWPMEHSEAFLKRFEGRVE